MDSRPTPDAEPPEGRLDELHPLEDEVRITEARAMPHAIDCASRSGRTCSCDWLGNVVATIESVGRDCYEKSIFLAAANPSKPTPPSAQPSAIADRAPRLRTS